MTRVHYPGTYRLTLVAAHSPAWVGCCLAPASLGAGASGRQTCRPLRDVQADQQSALDVTTKCCTGSCCFARCQDCRMDGQGTGLLQHMHVCSPTCTGWQHHDATCSRDTRTTAATTSRAHIHRLRYHATCSRDTRTTEATTSRAHSQAGRRLPLRLLGMLHCGQEQGRHNAERVRRHKGPAGSGLSLAGPAGQKCTEGADLP